MTVTYRGYPILPVLPSADRFDRPTPVTRTLTTRETPQGAFSVTAAPSEPGARTTWRLSWLCPDRPTAAAVLAFLASREGRAVPFWMPTCQADLALVGAADHLLLITACDYAARRFPDPAHQHLYFWWHGGTHQAVWHLTGAADNGDGTETLAGDASGTAAAGAIIAGGDSTPALPAFCSVLRFVRFDADEVTVTWHTATVCELTVPVVELPEETP